MSIEIALSDQIGKAKRRKQGTKEQEKAEASREWKPPLLLDFNRKNSER